MGLSKGRCAARIGIGLLALGFLGGCATTEELFSFRASGPKQAVAEAQPEHAHCRKVARERADDAVMARYVSAGTPEQHQVEFETYQECVSWARP